MDKKTLYRLFYLPKQIEQKQREIERIWDKLTAMSPNLSGMPHGGGGHDQVADGAINITEIKAVYREVLGELERMRNELDPLIDYLDNPDDRAVMRLRYIKGFSPEDIAEAIHRTDRSIYYYLSRAEDQLARKYPEKVRK